MAVASGNVKVSVTTESIREDHIPVKSDSMLPSERAEDISPMDMATMTACDYAADVGFQDSPPDSIWEEWNSAEAVSNVDEPDDDQDSLEKALESLPESTRALLHKFRFRPAYFSRIIQKAELKKEESADLQPVGFSPEFDELEQESLD